MLKKYILWAIVLYTFSVYSVTNVWNLFLVPYVKWGYVIQSSWEFILIISAYLCLVNTRHTEPLLDIFIGGCAGYASINFIHALIAVYKWNEGMQIDRALDETFNEYNFAYMLVGAIAGILFALYHVTNFPRIMGWR